MAKINYDSAVQQYVLEAAQTYYNLLLSQKLLQVYQEDLDVAFRQYQQDKILYENGLKTRSDLLSSETNWRSSQLALKMRSLEISKLRLQTATEKFDATQLKYKNGLMGATDLTVARQELISAQVDYATLLSELTLSRLRYQYALGEQLYDYKPEGL